MSISTPLYHDVLVILRKVIMCKKFAFDGGKIGIDTFDEVFVRALIFIESIDILFVTVCIFVELSSNTRQ